jgi:hypothetical protein
MRPDQRRVPYLTLTRPLITYLKEKFYQVGLEKFFNTYLDKDKYPAFYKHALLMFSLFVTTYNCEQHLSRMKHMKLQMRTIFTDVHLENYLFIVHNISHDQF